MPCLQGLLKLGFAEPAPDARYLFAGMEIQMYLTEIHVNFLLSW